VAVAVLDGSALVGAADAVVLAGVGLDDLEPTRPRPTGSTPHNSTGACALAITVATSSVNPTSRSSVSAGSRCSRIEDKVMGRTAGLRC
jgi:hypothetical protein